MRVGKVTPEIQLNLELNNNFHVQYIIVLSDFGALCRVVWIFGISDVSIHMPGSSSGNMNVMCKLL